MPSLFLDFSLPRAASKIPDLLAWVGRWWLTEFLQLFPDRLSEWLTDRGYKKLTLSTEPDCFVLQLLNDRRRPLASVRIARNAYAPASIDAFLKTHKLDRKRVALGIALPGDQLFTRQLILPVETARSIGDVVVQDLIAKTPFKLTHIFHDYESRWVDGKVAVWQWIVRREFVADAARAAGLTLTDLAFVESDACADDAPVPMVTLHQGRSSHHSPLRRTYYGLALVASLLVAIIGTHRYWRQQRILDDLTVQITAARTEAQQIRAAMDKLDQRMAAIVHLRLQKRNIPGLLAVWEETSAILPADSWLTELRLSEIPQKTDHLVAMTGFSTAAADLVSLVDKSPLFADAALTAPISLDPTEQRERFTLQAKLLQKRQNGKPGPW